MKISFLIIIFIIFYNFSIAYCQKIDFDWSKNIALNRLTIDKSGDSCISVDSEKKTINLSVNHSGYVLLESSHLSIDSAKEITFGFKAKVNNVNFDVSKSIHGSTVKHLAFCGLAFYDENYKIVYKRYPLKLSNTTDEWVDFHGVANVSMNVKYVRFEFLLNTNGQMQISDPYIVLNERKTLHDSLSECKKYIFNKEFNVDFSHNSSSIQKIDIRGAVCSSNWFNSKNINKFINRVKLNNGNKILLVGVSVLNGKLSFRWDESFNASEMFQLKNFITLCRLNGIEPIIEIYPGGFDSPIDYVNDDDFSKLTSKILQLYNLGVKEICLAFDDLDRWYALDSVQVKNIGKYHSFICDKLAKIWMGLSSDNKFYFLPMYYSIDNLEFNEMLLYFKYVNELDSRIFIILTFDYAIIDRDKVEKLRKYLNNKPVVIWDNFYANMFDYSDFKQNIPILGIPLNHRTKDLSDYVKGYLILPPVFNLEDKMLLSWVSSFIYSIDPKNYDASIASAYSLYVLLGKDVFNNVLNLLFTDKVLTKNQIRNEIESILIKTNKFELWEIQRLLKEFQL